MEPETLRLLLYVLIGGVGLVGTLVSSTIAVVKFVKKEVDEKMTKHFLHEHVLDKASGQTVRDRLVECRRVCPVTNPPRRSGGDHDTRGQYSDVRGRSR